MNQINLARELPGRVLANIAGYLKEVTEEDKKSRQPWLDEVNELKPYLAFTFEKLNNGADINELVSEVTKYNFQTFDTTFATCIFKLWCQIRGEILPRLGPVGVDKNYYNNERYVEVANFVIEQMNGFLTKIDKGFYPDYDKFLFYLIFYGCVTRKVFHDGYLGRPVSRFISPEDFLVDNDCKSIEESNRLTHILHLTKREIILLERDGKFTNPKLKYIDEDNEGEESNTSSQVNLGVYSKKSMFEFQESHVYMDLKEFYTESLETGEVEINELPLPYIITRCVATNRIVSIVPNWHDDDPDKKRINCFVHYNLFPSFGIYNMGLSQLLGCNAIAQTKLQRMIIDSGVHQNFPGGLYSTGLESLNKSINMVPGTFTYLDTGNRPIGEVISPLPFQGASPVMLQMTEMLTSQMQQLSGTTDIVSPENQNAPVGTTLAALETNTRLQSTVLQTVHKSFSDELQLVYEHFNFPIDYYDIVELHHISPVSDPSIESTTSRIVKAETIMKIASSDPQIHNMHNVYARMYEALGVEDIGSILISQEEMQARAEAANNKPEPLDPGRVEMADIEQRAAEVESKERIASMKLEGDGYKQEMELLLQQEKLAAEEEKNKMKAELELEKLRAKEVEVEGKKELELLRIAHTDDKVKLEERIAQLEMENQILRGKDEQGAPEIVDGEL